jgi:G3E family GTPase
MTDAHARIPIALVTGFLGSGKTTFLEAVAARHRGRRLVFLVNEFSPRDVDGIRLRASADRVLTVAGGSIFCRCVVTEFLYHLKDLPERYGAPGSPVDGVVVEASGMADPTAAAPLFRETGLDARYRLASVTALVDPGSIGKVIHTLPAARAQLEAASVVLLNKTDLAAPGAVEAAERLVREIAPVARILRTVRASAEVDLFGDSAPPPDRAGRLSDCVDPRVGRLLVRFRGPADLDDFRRRLESLGDDVYRAKGFVPTPDGRMVAVDLSPAGLTLLETPPGPAEPEVAVVVRGPALARAAQLLAGTPNAGLFDDPSGVSLPA